MPRPTMALLGAVAALCVVAAACGGSGNTVVAASESLDASGAAPAVPAASPVVDFSETRPGLGIAAAGGNPQAVRGPDPCQNPGSAQDDPLAVAYVGADLSELEAIGFEMTVVEDPSLVISAYINEINFHGGVNGRCIEFDVHLWSLADPLASFIEVCGHMSEHDPVFNFSFQLYDSGLNCSTFGTPLPTIGLYTSRPDSAVAEADHLLYSDNGSVEHLLARTAEVALSAGVAQAGDRVGLLHGSGASAGVPVTTSEEILQDAGLNVVAAAEVPPAFGELELLLPEAEAHLAGATGEGHDHESEGDESLTPEQEATLGQIEEFYPAAVERFREAGATVVMATSHWADVRRMMRAADRIDWAPTWLINDTQPATLTTSGTPSRQVENLRQVSARRAAGDVVPPLDQGCVTMRNTASDAAPFNHRPHTDAWNLINAICDYLDVAFSALTRIDGDVNHATLIESLNETDYEAGYGGLIVFDAANRNGAQRFRVLRPDSGCVLNYWGCMRSTTDWLSPAHGHDHEEVSPDDIAQVMDEHGHDHGTGSESGVQEADETELEDDSHQGH